MRLLTLLSILVPVQRCRGFVTPLRSIKASHPASLTLSRGFLKTQRYQRHPARQSLVLREERWDDRDPYRRNKVSTFLDGFVHIHRNYLDIVWLLYSRVFATGIAFWGLFAGALFISPRLCYDTMSGLDKLGRGIADVMSLSSRPLRLLVEIPILFIPLVLMIVLVVPSRGLVTIFANSRNRAFASTGRRFQKILDYAIKIPVKAIAMRWDDVVARYGVVGATRDILYSSSSLSTAWLNVLANLSSAPFAEEVLFRWILSKAWRRDEPLMDPDMDYPRKLWFGRYDPFMVVSSVLFAAAQFPVWYNSGSFFRRQIVALEPRVSGRVALMIPFVYAASQFAAMYTLSLVILTPLYLQAGLSASFGAHVAWNFFMGFLGPINIFVRVVARFARKARGGNERMPWGPEEAWRTDDIEWSEPGY